MSNQPSYKAESQKLSSAGGFFKLFSLLALILTLLLLSNSSISAKVAEQNDGSVVSRAPSAPAPGGVTDNVAIWYTGESASSSPVATWSDLSGNGNDATQATAAQQPTVVSNVLNGQSVVRFDGGDRLQTAAISALDLRTSMIIVGKHSNSTTGGDVFVRSAYATNAHLTGIYGQNGNLNAHARTGSGAFRGVVTPGNTNYNIIGLRWDSGSAVELFLNGSLINTATGATANPSGHISTVFGDNYSVAGFNLNGDIAEAIIFAGEPNDAQLNIIFNYLSAKYDLALTANDFYAGDTAANGDYDFDVAGIGQQVTREASGDSAGLIISQANESLANGEYVLAGHKTTTNAWTTDDLPAGTTQRWSRVWYFDKTGTVDTNLTFDFSDAGISGTPSGEYKLLYSATNAFSFSDTGVNATITDDQVQFTVPSATLLDGYYTLAEGGGVTGAPGGVTNNLTVWLKGDAGTSTTVNGQRVTSWMDQSGNSNDATQPTWNNQPKYITNLLNGYAGLHFYDGTHNHLKTGAIPALDTRPTVFLVGKHDNQGANIFIRSNYSSGAGSTSHILTGIFGENGSDNGHARTSTGSFRASNTTADTNFHLYNLEWNSSNQVILYRDGISAGTTTGANATPSGHVQTVIGSNSSNLSNSLNGDITEVVIFAGTPTASEREQVSSYLALKYGLTLPYSYRASSGATVYDVTGYDNHIAGIGRDDGSQWAQTSSQSVVSGAVLRILHNDSFAADQTFLVWGHNGGASTIGTNAGVPSGVAQWLERRWKVQETNSVGSVTVRVPTNRLAALTAGGDYLLIVADDANFTSNVQTVPMTTYGLDKQVTFDFNGTQYFTFGRGTASPSITNVQPASAISQFATQIYIDGTVFQDGATVELNTTALDTTYVSPTRLTAWVPAGQANGTYNLTVTNPDGSTGNLAAAFTVQSPALGDLLTSNNKLLSTPLAPKAGDSTNLALVVNQQGGSSTLSNVAVDFYRGAPNAGGTLLGRGTIASLAPDSAATTTAVNFTAPAAGTYTFYAVIDPDSAVTEASESNNTVSRQITILPSATDSIKPTITKLTLDGGAQDTRDRKIRISLTGSDNVGVKRYRITELAYVPSTRNWGLVQEAEWQNYTGRDFDWTLTPEGGGRYIQAYLSDAAGNVSTVKQQIITHLPTAEQLPAGGLRYYVYNLAVGDNLETTVTPIQGNPDFYMYDPSQQVVAYGIQRDLFVDRADYTAVDADYHTTLLVARNRTYFNASFLLTEGFGNQPVMSRALLNDIGAPIPIISDTITIDGAIPAPPIGDLSVEMDTMTTTATLDAITFNWTTTSETDNVGFNVYRSTSPDEIGEQINGALINSRASDGAAYSFVDSAAELYETYYYTLESIKTDGQSSFYVAVTGALVATHSNVTIVAGSTDTNINRSEDGSNVTYAPTADSASVGADNIAADLAGGFNVLISTVSTGTGTQDGDISMSASTGITWTTGVSLTMTANRRIVLNGGSSLNATGDGSITLNGNPSGTTTGNFTGIELVNSPIQSGSGNITLNGTGGDTGGFGVYLRQNGSQLTTSGDIQVTGDGPANQGIRLVDGILIEATGSGNVTISGTSAAQDGIHYDANSQAGGGIKSDSGTIQITGNSSATDGMELREGGSVSSVSGDVTVDGDSTGTGDGVLCPCFVSTGGNLLIQGDSSGGDGMEIRAGAQITTTGTGTLTLEGTGTTFGILLTSSASNLVQSGTGALTLTTDNLGLGNGAVAGSGTLTIQPFTANASIGIGGGTGTLNIDDAELGRLTDGFSSITIGNVVTGTGDVDIDSATFLDDVTIAGGTINDNAGTDITAPSVTLDGNVAPGQSLGQLVVSGDLNLTSGESLTLELNGTTPVTEHDQVDVTGAVTLNDAILTGTLGFTPTVGDELMIILNDGSDAVTGTFNGLAEGDTITIGGTAFTISYTGGDGNDVVLFMNAAPVAVDDSGSTDEDSVLNVAASGVLANDTDANGDTLTVSEADTSSANGAVVTVNSDGSYSYDPTAALTLQALAAGESLIDTFSYTVSDGTLTDTAVVSITVSGINDAPVLSNVTLTSSISENDTGTLSGQISDVDSSDTFTLTVDWGDGSSESYNYAAGTSSFTETHQYLDDDPTGTASDNYTVTLTLADPNGGNDSDSALITVNNVAPNLMNLSATNIDENDSTTLTAQITDVGTQDSFTLMVEWGDGISDTVSYPAGTSAFTLTHQYLDDEVLARALLNDFSIVATIEDDDTGSSQSSVVINVANVAPSLQNLAVTSPINENDTATLTGEIVDPGTQDSFTLVIDWGDSISETVSYPAGTTNFTETHHYLDDDPTTTPSDDVSITLDISDDDGGTNTTVTMLTIVNVVPDVDAGADEAINEGEDVTFSGSFTDTGTLDTHSIAWDFGDGETITGTLSPTQTYNLDGVYTVTLTITDDDSGVGQDTMNVYVGEFGPIAADDNYSTDEDTLLTVSAPGVLDNDLDIDGDPLTAILQSGPSEGALMLNADGSFVYTPTLNFNGEVTFTYVANDGNQDSNSATVTISVISVNDAPLVDAGDDQTTDEGEEVQFEGSFTDPGLRMASGVSIEWDLGDGTTIMDTLNPTHTYQDDGTFTVTLTVTDSEGASSSDALLVTVVNVAPIVEVSGQMTATAGIAIDFTGTFSDPSPLDTHTIVWDFGDGETATDTLTPSHSYDTSGSYTVTLTITDDDGGVGSDSLIVTVSGTATAVTLTTLRANSNWVPSVLLLTLFAVGMAWRSRKTRERRDGQTCVH